jgi:C-terminal processing protease CtpA/Prc
MVGGFFDHDVKIADRVQRKESKPQIAKPIHHVFDGKLIVLVDSESASASELFARVMQIEKRGVVLGDHSSGSVMEATHYQYQLGTDTVVFYGASITDVDLIMTDGTSLEHVGVEPDKLLIPSAGAIAAGRDPVLAYAAGQLGVKIDPVDAGKLFPYEWAPRNSRLRHAKGLCALGRGRSHLRALLTED